MSNLAWCIAVAIAFGMGLVVGVLAGKRQASLKSGSSGVEITAGTPAEVLALFDHLRKSAMVESAISRSRSPA